MTVSSSGLRLLRWMKMPSRRIQSMLVLFVLAGLLLAQAIPPVTTPAALAPTAWPVEASVDQSPVYFIENQGQSEHAAHRAGQKRYRAGDLHPYRLP